MNRDFCLPPSWFLPSQKRWKKFLFLLVVGLLMEIPLESPEMLFFVLPWNVGAKSQGCKCRFKWISKESACEINGQKRGKASIFDDQSIFYIWPLPPCPLIHQQTFAIIPQYPSPHTIFSFSSISLDYFQHFWLLFTSFSSTICKNLIPFALWKSSCIILWYTLQTIDLKNY